MVINEKMAQVILYLFCRLDVAWVIEHVLALHLKTAEFFQIPRVWASYFVQTLESASNQSQFNVKQCLGLLSLLRGGPINLGRLIAKNIKYMDNAAQKAYGHFCVMNELCKREGVSVYSDDEILSLKAPLSASIIRKLQNMHQGEAAQNDQQENQQGNEEEFNQPQNTNLKHCKVNKHQNFKEG